MSFKTDMEKTARGTCGDFVGNHSILRTFWAKYPVIFTEDCKKRVEDGKFMLDKIYLR